MSKLIPEDVLQLMMKREIAQLILKEYDEIHRKTLEDIEQKLMDRYQKAGLIHHYVDLKNNNAEVHKGLLS